MTPTPLEDVVEAAKDGIHGIESSFTQPTDDWQPVLVIVGERGPEGQEGEGLAVSVVGVDAEFMANDMTKDILANEVIPQLAADTQAVAMAMVSSAWYVEAGPGVDTAIRPSENPNRKEGVFLHAVALESSYFGAAEIIRTANLPPMLMPWDEKYGGEVATVGRFPAAMRAALEAIQ
jgi:hypothetical protein